MTTRRLALVTIWALSILALAFAFSLQANANASVADEVLSDVVSGDVEVAIAPQDGPAAAPLPVTPPTLVTMPTPVAPPAWIEIPDDLIATPTPEASEAVPLPMLTNIRSAPRDGSVVYLTFDDGPDPVYTNQILDVLARYGARATFFVLGNSVDAHPSVAQRIVNEGHAIANHTYYHEALPRESPERVVQTLEATNNAIARATGRTSSCLRPPYGSLDQATFDLVTSLGYQVSMWEVDSRDWQLNDAYTIAAGVLRDTNLGNRVLFHDGPANRAATVGAVESVLSVLSERGVQFHALPC